MAKNSRARAVKEFSIEKMVESHILVYEQALK
jgi:hypothetical protein